MKKFENKVVLVTGAGGGLGHAIAVAFAKKGAKLALVDLKEEFLNKVKADVEALGAETLTFGGDVSDYETVRNIFQDTAKKLGSVDVACNNAGVVGIGSIEELTTKNGTVY